MNKELLNKFASILIDKMEQMQNQKWEQPWFNASYTNGFMPMNLSSRTYKSGNAFFLFIVSMMRGYKTPIFATFKQLKDVEASVNKGEKSLPVIYYDFLVKQIESGEKITLPEYNKLSKDEQGKYKVIPFLKYYNVFNLDQSNYAEVHQDKYNEFVVKYKPNEGEVDTDNKFKHTKLDKLVSDNLWVCPIHTKTQNRAYYSPNTDSIVLPKKQQFKTGQLFYGTMLHEMAHSTGTANRLNRAKGSSFGDKNYAREEVVAEFTSAFTSVQMGINTVPSTDNITYLNGWLKHLKEKPEDIIKFLNDVTAASNYILERVEKINN